MFIFTIADFINPSSHIVVLGYKYLSVPCYILKSSQDCMIYNIVNAVHVLTTLVIVVKPLLHQTALPQRLHSVLKSCQHAVGSPRNTPKNIKFVSYSVYTTSSQRPYSVHTTFPKRLYSVLDVFTARKQLLQRVHSAHTARSRRAHSVLTARTQRPHGKYSV